MAAVREGSGLENKRLHTHTHTYSRRDSADYNAFYQWIKPNLADMYVSIYAPSLLQFCRSTDIAVVRHSNQNTTPD